MRQQPGGARLESRTVRSIGADVQESRGIGPLAPPRAQQDPGPSGNPAVLAFPCLDAFHGQQEVGVRLDIAGHVDDACRSDKTARRNRVARAVGQILSGDPVHGGVEMRAGVLAKAQRVPVPRRPPAVVLRDDVDGDARRRGEHRRELDDRGRRSERLCQIDDAERAAAERGDEIGEDGGAHDRRLRANWNRFSKTITCRSGFDSAMPSPIDEAGPIACRR